MVCVKFTTASFTTIYPSCSNSSCLKKTDFWNEDCKLAPSKYRRFLRCCSRWTRWICCNHHQVHGVCFDKHCKDMKKYLYGKNIVHFGFRSDNLLVNQRDAQRPICNLLS